MRAVEEDVLKLFSVLDTLWFLGVCLSGAVVCALDERKFSGTSLVDPPELEAICSKIRRCSVVDHGKVEGEI